MNRGERPRPPLFASNGWQRERALHPSAPPLAVATGLIGGVFVLAVLLPVRWDLKTVATVVPKARSREIPRGEDIVLVSRDARWRTAHAGLYGLDLLIFPSGRHAWLVLNPVEEVSGAQPDLVWSPRGFTRPDGSPAPAAAHWIFDPRTVLLADSPAVASEIEVLWPTRLRRALLLLADEQARWIVRPPHTVRPAALLRVGAHVTAFTCWLFSLWRRAATSPRRRLVWVAAGVPLASFRHAVLVWGPRASSCRTHKGCSRAPRSYSLVHSYEVRVHRHVAD